LLTYFARQPVSVAAAPARPKCPRLVRAQPVHPVTRLPFLEFFLEGIVTFGRAAFAAFV
jgi:hypothetical protein